MPDVTEQDQQYSREEFIEPVDELIVEVMQAEFQGVELTEPEPMYVPAAPVSSANHDSSTFVYLFQFGTNEWVLETGRYMMGRNETCHVSIDDGSVSSFHCLLDIKSDSMEAQDFNSTNGTYINGRRVEGPSALKVGEELCLGQVAFSIRSVLRARYAKRVVYATPIYLSEKGVTVAAAETAPEPTNGAPPTSSRLSGAAMPKDEPIRYKAKPEPGRTISLAGLFPRQKSK